MEIVSVLLQCVLECTQPWDAAFELLEISKSPHIPGDEEDQSNDTQF